MKFLKIILIIVLLVVMCSISFGTGTITSGDKTIYLSEPEEKSILNDWFKNLPITEKMKLYTYWHGLNHYRSEFDDRLMWLEKRVIEKENVHHTHLTGLIGQLSRRLMKIEEDTSLVANWVNTYYEFAEEYDLNE